MVSIKLARTGTKHQAHYRFVVLDRKKPTNGAVIETLGYYDPSPKVPKIEVSEERVAYWLGLGAQPTDSVRNLLKHNGIWQRFVASKASK
jgi:small subunit ribosomal protein S16